MKAIWDSEAKKAQRQVASYIRKEFGVKRAKKFRQEVDKLSTSSCVVLASGR